MSNQQRTMKANNNSLVITSLPIPYQSGLICTWDFFFYDDARKYHILDWLKANGCNAIVVLLENLDPNNRFTIFKDKFGGKIDRAKRDMVVSWAKTIHDNGGIFVPCIHSDANSAIVKAYNQHMTAMSIYGDMLEPFVDGWIFALEGNETQMFTREEQEGAVNYLRDSVTDKPVGSHGRWNDRCPRNVDFWALEMPWSPLEGDSHSSLEVVNYTKNSIEKAKVPMWVLEDCWNPVEQVCRDHAQAVSGVPMVVGVGAPIS